MGALKLAVMAWRNLWRQTRRTLITVSSVALSVFLAVMFTGLQDRSWEDAIGTAARLGGGHVTLEHLDYREKPALSRTVEIPKDTLARITAIPGVTHALPRIVGQVMLSTTADSFGAGFIAYDPALESRDTLSLFDALKQGTLFQTAQDPGIILGERLAHNLGASLGTKVVYTLTDEQGQIVTALARVSGILRTGSPSVDLGLCLLPLGSVQKALGYSDGETVQVAVLLQDQRRSRHIAQTLAGLVGPKVAARSWQETQPDLVSIIAVKRGGTTFMEILILVLCAAGIFNTMFVSVMERLREFGILTALGFGPWRLFGLVMLESLWVACLGLVAAALVTAWPYHFMATTGYDMSALAGDRNVDVAGIGVSLILHVGIYPENVVIICVAAVLATLLSGLYPAWRAGRVEPVDAIKLV